MKSNLRLKVLVPTLVLALLAAAAIAGAFYGSGGDTPATGYCDTSTGEATFVNHGASADIVSGACQ